MLHEYLQILPDDPGAYGRCIAAFAAVVGLFLWVCGAKVSRPHVTLLTVLIGALIGLRLPAWFGWQISGAGPAVGGAVLLGISGYVLHRTWIALGLGTVLALWAGFVVWMKMHGTNEWNWPAIDSTTTVAGYLSQLWQQVPPAMSRIGPFACGAALVSGIAFTILWPKLATVIAWSAAGTTSAALGAIATIAYWRPEWLESVTEKSWIQATTLLAATAVGAAVQWKLTAKASRRGGGGKPKSDKPEGAKK